MDSRAYSGEFTPIGADDVRQIVETLLSERTIPMHPVYFFEGRWLITYEWYAEQMKEVGDQLQHLHKAVARMERPWWRRWLNR